MYFLQTDIKTTDIKR